MTDATSIPITSSHDPRRNRSRVTNGALFPPGVDGRCYEARRWRDIYLHFREQTPLDSADLAVDAQLRSLATISLRLEEMTAHAARGDRIDDDQLVRAINTQGRLMETLRLMPEPSTTERPDPEELIDRVRDPDHWKSRR